MPRRHAIEARPVPGEALKQKSAIDKKINLYTHNFVKVNQEVGLTKHDPPSTWAAKLSWVANNHIRIEGFNPFQAVWGRGIRIPTNLLSDEASLPTLSAAADPPSNATDLLQVGQYASNQPGGRPEGSLDAATGQKETLLADGEVTPRWAASVCNWPQAGMAQHL